MFELGTQRPSSRRLWLFAAGVLVAVLAVVLVVYLLIRPTPAKEAGHVVGFTPPPTPTVTGSITPQSPTVNVVIVRGGRTGCLGVIGCGADNYAAILQAELGWNLAVDGHKDTGYLAGSKSTPNSSFVVRAAAAIKTKPDLLILEGSVSDARYDAADVQRAAQALYVQLKQASPSTTIVVVGPIWDGPPTDAITALDSALRSAAKGRVAKYIDPVAEKWFPTDDPKLFSSDHISPTGRGHAAIATKLQADLASVVPGS